MQGTQPGPSQQLPEPGIQAQPQADGQEGGAGPSTQQGPGADTQAAAAAAGAQAVPGSVLTAQVGVVGACLELAHSERFRCRFVHDVGVACMIQFQH